MVIDKRITILEVEAALADAFSQMGGVQVFETWAHSNPSDFLKVLTRFVPESVIRGQRRGEITRTVTLGELLHFANTPTEEERP